MARVRVMSYNIRALKDDRAALVGVIRAHAPDVLCVQEAPRHPLSGFRVSALGDDCGLFWVGGRGRGLMSTTLLLNPRLDLEASGHRQLPVHWWEEPRGWAYARVRLPGRSALTVASVHLSLRTSEHRAHADLLRGAPESAGPLVVAGDINETEGGPGWTHLAEGLVDVGGDVPTFPARDPTKRIDAIFSSPGLRPRPVEPVADDADLVAATDHRPVAVDLEID